MCKKTWKREKFTFLTIVRKVAVPVNYKDQRLLEFIVYYTELQNGL